MAEPRGIGRGPRLTCPECGKRGVNLRQAKEDHYGCRYCDWFAFTSGYDKQDVEGRAALAAANPEEDI